MGGNSTSWNLVIDGVTEESGSEAGEMEPAMTVTEEFGSKTIGTLPAAAVDLLIAVAGPVNEEDLRQKATDAVRSLGAPPNTRIAIATPATHVPDATASRTVAGDIHYFNYPLASSALPSLPWLAAPTAYREIARLAETTGARACVILGQDLGALSGAAVAALAEPMMEGRSLLSMPLYPSGKYEALLNSGILYPFTRALYGKQVRHPFAVDFGVAGRMLSLLATGVDRGPARPIVCPMVESGLNDIAIAQSYVDVRHVAVGEGVDLSTVLGKLAGTVFEDAEKNASIWQRTRGSQPTSVFGTPGGEVDDREGVDLRPLIESFNLGSRNLQEIWGLVLPPVTLLELKRLARLPAEQFRMPDVLWAKIVYDFALAHRLRSISRTHLLGALTPLYLGWVASYAAEIQTGDAAMAEQRIEQLAVAYEQSKPYFVSRWRWPDRFNP